MKLEIVENPDRNCWDILIKRPKLDTAQLFDLVNAIFDDIETRGDTAVRNYEEKYDKVILSDLFVSDKEKEEAKKSVSDSLKQALNTAKENIEKFHILQKHDEIAVETTKGVICRQKALPIEKVGLYIPGGTAPLFSTVLMLAIPAKIAGCKEVILCSPPNKEGKIHSAVIYAASIAGVDKIVKVGGIQAIAAMTMGTESIPRVYKIFGPGNQYVTAAKQIASIKGVAIDMPAGPSEVEVIADETANPAFVASDLLSQAEHGADSQVMLIATSKPVAEAVLVEVEQQLSSLPRREFAEKALGNSKIVVFDAESDGISLNDNESRIIDFTNLYAPEHLIIETKNYRAIAEKISNAGSVFLGNFTPESAGDYASGTNHTLPTNGYARSYSGVNLDSFTKKITFQEITREGIENLGDTIRILAENEQLIAHSNAVRLRMQK